MLLIQRFMQDDPYNYAADAIKTVVYAGRPLCRTTLTLMMLLTLWFMEDDPYARVIYAIDGAKSC